MAIGVTAKLTVKPGANQAFVQLMKQLVNEVTTHEPGCLLYALHQSREDSQTYIVLEQYANEAALIAHPKTAHYQNYSKQMAQYLAAAPVIELMDTV